MFLKKRWGGSLTALAVAAALFAAPAAAVEYEMPAEAGAEAFAYRDAFGYQRTLPFLCDQAGQKFVLDAFDANPKTNCNGISFAAGGNWKTGSGAGLVNGTYKAMDKSSAGSAAGVFSPTITIDGFYRVYVGFNRTHARARNTIWEVYSDDGIRGKDYRIGVKEYSQPGGPNWADFGVFRFKPRKASTAPTRGYLRLTNSDIASESVDAVHFELVAPYKVKNFTAEQGVKTYRVLLRWDAAPLATIYRIYRTPTFRRPVKADFLGSTKTLFFADNSREVLDHPGVPYFYWIVAVTPKGASAAAPTKGWVAVAPPTDLAALPPAADDVTLTWTEPASGAMQYRIYRKESDTPAPVSPAEALATIDAPAAQYTDTPPVKDQDYFYWVEAVGNNDGRFSASSLAGPVTGRTLP